MKLKREKRVEERNKGRRLRDDLGDLGGEE